MATSYTSLLGLALPTTGELQGTWGATVNDSITSLLDTAVAGTTVLSTDADVTLTSTTGSANQARQAIILWTANGSVTRNITAPAQSKAYVVINNSAGTQSIVLRGVGPTTGVTVVKGERALVAWNGSDFVKVSTAGVPLPAADGGTGQSSYAVGDLLYASGATTLAKLADVATGNALISGGVGVAPAWGKVGLTTHISGTLAVANGGSGATTAQTAMNTFAGAVTSGQYLRGNGTNVVMSAIQAGDVPTLNQNTTGTAANVTGVVAAANGGTGQSSYAVGDLLYASASTTISKLADVATGNALISGGVGVAPSWGKVGLTTHISGTLAVGNGGTGATTAADARTNLDVPTRTGGNASGTWGINITGSAASATNATFASSATNAGYATNAGTATNWGSYGGVPGAGTSFGNANTIGRSDANGYTYFGYINSSTTNSETVSVNQIIVTNGVDNFYRKSSLANLTTAVQGAASGTWSINVTGSASSATNASFASSSTNASYATNSGYATTAGRAYPRRSDGGDLNFYWSGQSGQPTWLWGGNDGVNMYVYNPSNFSVASATNASAATNAGYATNSGYASSAGSATNAGYATNSGYASSAGSATNAGYASSAGALSTASGSAPSYAARAWVNFNGTGTVAIRASGNVSSITDNGTGDYTVNFSTAMSDANFSAVVSAQIESNGTNWVVPSLYRDGNPFATGSVRVTMSPSGAGGGGNVDGDYICATVYR